MDNARCRIVENITEVIGATPLVRLQRIVRPDSEAEILGKMEALNPGGSLKDRACLAMIDEALEKGLIKKGSTVIEPTSGNTGIGLAMICAVKGLRCILTMPEAMSLERNYLLRVYGAEVVLTPTEKGMPGAIAKAEELAHKIPGSFIPRQFDNEANKRIHRETTAQEIFNACRGKLDAFVMGVGTGGTVSGTGEALKSLLPDIRIVAVEPKKSPVLSGGRPGRHSIQGIGAGFVPKILNRDVIDEIIPVDDNEAFAMTRRLGREEGLCVGMSSGANIVAALTVARRLGVGKRVVAVLCDTGERYFTMEQYFEA